MSPEDTAGLGSDIFPESGNGSQAGFPAVQSEANAAAPVFERQRMGTDDGIDAGLALGTAEWLENRDAVARFEFRIDRFRAGPGWLDDGRADGQIWIGNSLTYDPFPLGYSDDRHVCLVSGNRGGKGTSVIIPNLCYWPGSCIVIDPKGENATLTALRRGAGSDHCIGMGQSVRILDPFGVVRLDPKLRGRFNPLDTIDPKGDYAVDDAALIAAALIPVESQTEPFFEKAARALTKAVILHVLTAPDFDGRRNLVTVWKLINQGDWINHGILKDLGREKLPSPFSLLWQAMKINPAYNGMICGEGLQMIDMADKTRSSILKVAQDELAFIGSPPMSRIMAASDFSLSELKTNPQGLSIFLTLPQRYMVTHYGWLRLMVDLSTNEMERIPGRPATGHQTLFVLDEFAGLRWMERMEEGAAQAAGAGIKYLYVLQNLAQLKKNYKDSWETFLGNAGLKIFFSIEDNFTRSYISQQVGELEVRRGTQSGSNAKSRSLTNTAGNTTSKTEGESQTKTSGQTTTLGSSTTRGFSSSTTATSGSGSNSGWSGMSGHSGSNQSNSNSQTTGTSDAFTTSRSTADSSSTADGTSRSDATGTSASEARGLTDSQTAGWGESIHKRALMNPDEVGRILARVDDTENEMYPGFGLALIPGQQPLLFRRVNYFESLMFLAHHDPHPDFPPSFSIAELLPLPWRLVWATFQIKLLSRALAPPKLPKAPAAFRPAPPPASASEVNDDETMSLPSEKTLTLREWIIIGGVLLFLFLLATFLTTR